MKDAAVEDYIKAIYSLTMEDGHGRVSTKSLSEMLGFKSSSVSEMMGKLEELGLITRKKYYGVALTQEGRQTAVYILRKHRLWEYFLVEKLRFSWSEVHDVAEQLEHIHSRTLIDKLDDFLGNPSHDPHGHPIPDKEGNYQKLEKLSLLEVPVGRQVQITGVLDDSTSFLDYLSGLQLNLGSSMKIVHRNAFDGLITLEIEGKEVRLSRKASENLLVKIMNE